jgi:transcription termination/antitermination protein NusG
VSSEREVQFQTEDVSRPPVLRARGRSYAVARVGPGLDCVTNTMPFMNYLPWFALYVKPRHEKNVAVMLEAKGYEAFLPTYRHRVKYHKSFELPLFPSYVFCRLDVSKRLPVMTTPGVFSIVGNGPEPEPVSEQEVQVVRRMLQSGLVPIPWPYVLPGDEVCLDSGPLQGVQGVVVDASDGKWLVVSIDLLRRSVAVKVQREFLSVKVMSATKAKWRTPVIAPPGVSGP